MCHKHIEEISLYGRSRAEVVGTYGGIMSDLKDMLEKLRELDDNLYTKITDIIWNLDSYGSPYENDIIQGEIQRAIEAQGWDVTTWFKDNKWTTLIRLPGGYIDLSKCFGEEANSPASAILAAYLEALRQA
jgi:hypothetical protein